MDGLKIIEFRIDTFISTPIKLNILAVQRNNQSKDIMLKHIALLFFISFTSLSFSQTQLASFFSDHMVLQQQDQVSVWGKDTPKTVVKVTGSWGEEASVETDKNGQWKLKLQTPIAGGPFMISIIGSSSVTLKDVMIGEVWLCSGQSNMEMPVKGNNNQPINGSNEAILNSENNHIRLFETKKKPSLTPLDDVEGNWKVASPESVGDFSATAYFFAKKMESVLHVPIGLIVSSWGASSAEAWTDKETLSSFKSVSFPIQFDNEHVQKTPTALYNGMLHPIIGYTIKGAIWYQGEGNKERAEDYTRLVNDMVSSWRNKWQQGDFPFYFVQIAPFNYGKKVNSAFLREAQLKTMQTLNNSGMASTLDIGDCNYIHPREKITVGNRLAYWALAKDYGIKGIEYSGPVYQSMKVLGEGEVELAFGKTPNGISSFGKPLDGFEMAGSDKVFYPAVAKIKKEAGVLSLKSSEVKSPIAVRYAFDNCVEASLFSTGGIPASSFRTDNWTD